MYVQVLVTVQDSYVYIKAVEAPQFSLPYMFGLKDGSWVPLQFASATFPGLADALERLKVRSCYYDAMFVCLARNQFI